MKRSKQYPKARSLAQRETELNDQIKAFQLRNRALVEAQEMNALVKDENARERKALEELEAELVKREAAVALRETAVPA